MSKVLLSSILLLALPALAAAADWPRQVTVGNGALEGAAADGVLSFKGIPFAAPPTGALRWRPPQPAADWQGTRAATAFAADCMQLPFPDDAAPLRTEPAEDCLYLNVWRPAAGDAPLPVLVWIYGGGFVNGGTSPAVYDGSAFARRGLVFVSFNYRLGRFGFFAHPALAAEHPDEPRGNYATLDQLAALRWVQDNIAAFGGDPGQVTVFGESAGGGSVLTLMTSPMADGLLHRAAVMSGGGRDALMGARLIDQPSPGGAPSLQSVGRAFARAKGIEGDDAAALAALRALPAEQVVDGLNLASMWQSAATHGGPVIDGRIATAFPDALLRSGQAPRIPLLVGATSMDIGFNSAQTMDALFAPFGARQDAARAAYGADSGNLQQVGYLVAMDRMMIEPARHLATLNARRGVPAWHYRFSYVAESMRGQWPGAPHATEIPFVFDTVAAKYGDALTDADRATARAANAYFANFARTGDPNGEGLPPWPAYEPQADPLLDFTAEGPRAGPDPWKTRLDLTAGTWPQ